jgi:RNA polymerase sigma factor (sigma-70 family)
MNINDEYQRYCASPTDENLARLFNAAREYAWRIGQELFSGIPNTRFHHACENAATTVLLDFDEKYDQQRGSFSTWAYQSIRGDLIDWRRGKRWGLEDSLDDPDFDHRKFKQLREEPTLVDEKLRLERILSSLSEDERTLCELKAQEVSLYGIATTLGVSLATVKRRWRAILEKCRNVGVR